MSSGSGWIGVDLDRTLSFYDRWRGADVIGAPIVPMVKRVIKWRKDGHDVRIFTARISDDTSKTARTAIKEWCLTHLGEALPITNQKDFWCVQLWDDIAVSVLPNKGIPGLPKGVV